jgi:DNA-binding winged helix-turn-helix (wHTH) protein/tetratricopeptide (TPR) repeat protein
MSGAAPTWELGPFRLDPLTRVLWRGENLVPLTPRALDLLIALVEKGGDVATKAELLAKVWPDVVVAEANLSVTMSALRRALGEPEDGGGYIQTVPRRGYRFVGPLSGVTEERPSLAVLPFRVLGDPEDPLGLGMADAVISRLAGVEGLVVRPLGAVARFTSSPVGPQQAARELGVDAVLEGTVQRHEGRVRASVHLVPGRGGSRAWAETFEEPLSGVFELQDAVAEGVAQAVAPRLGVPAAVPPHRRPCLDAYEAYLLGRLHWSRFSIHGIGKALACFGEAAQKDPGYAAPHAGLADAYLVLGIAGVVAPAEAWTVARSCAERALQLDPGLGSAHASLGFIRLFESWDWADARRSFEQAVALRPPSAGARACRALFLGLCGELPAALREATHARETDPLSPGTSVIAAFLHGLAGEPETELDLARRAAEIEPGHFLSQWSLGRACLHNGLEEGALAAMDRALALVEGGPAMKAARAATLALVGRAAEARGILSELDAMARRTWVSPYQRAAVAAALREPEAALQRLEEACDLRDPWLAFVKVDPAFAALRGDPRFAALEARVSSAP